MSETKKLKEQTTKNIHSLLLSGGACSIQKLERDYRQLVAPCIPYRELGYANLENYLRDCEQHFRIYWDGPIKMIKHVTNEETIHIERMINSQRKPRKRSKPTYPPRSSYHTGYQRSYSFHGQRSYPKPQHQPDPVRLEATVPSILRGKIKGLLYDYKTGLLGSNFDAAYCKRFGTHIDFRAHRFDSLFDLLKSMSDIVQIEEDPSGIYKVYPKIGNRTPATDSTASYDSRQKNLPPRFQKKAQEVQQQKTEEAVSAAMDEDLWDDDPYDTSGVSLQLQKEIKEVLAKHPKGVWAAEFPAEYRIMFRRELDRRGQGFESVISLMSALPHLVTIQRPNQKDWLLFDSSIAQQPKYSRSRTSSTKSSASSSQGKASLNTAPPLTEDMRETIRQVIAHHPAGLLLGELSQVFQELTGETIDLDKLGYATLDSLVTSTALADTVGLRYQEIAGQSGQVMLFAKNVENPPRQDKLKNLRVLPAMTVQRVSCNRRREIPADAVGPGAMYRQQGIPESVLQQRLRYIEVYVSTVTNPGHLWIQVKGEGTDRLEQVMDDLEATYNDKDVAEAYTLPAELITVGQVCAAIYPNDGDWHRCTITGIRDMDFVEVYYVDYGSSYVVTQKSLKFLKMCYLKLPAQAIKAKLANIVPVNGSDWTRAAKDRLLYLVSNRPLIALITDISQDNILSLCLTDTSTEKDLHLNDLLVMEGLAKLEVHEPSAAEPEPEPVVLQYEEPKPEPIPSERKPSTTSQSPPPEVEGERRVKYVELTEGHSLHIIRWNDLPYAVSYEISNLLWPGRDIIRSMMRQKKMNVSKVVLSRDENYLLFEELYSNEVGGMLDADNKQKSHITIFELASVLQILEIFSHPNYDLKEAVKLQIDMFDPEDSYWKTANDDSDDLDDSETDSEDAYTYGKETLETALHSLQFRRKKILEAMKSMNASNSTRLVEDLQNVERQQGEIKKKIAELEKLEKDQSSGKSSSISKKLSPEDELVCAVVSEQNDSYLERNTASSGHEVPSSPSAKVVPLQQSTVSKAGIKTNPVAPMPAANQSPQVSADASLTSMMDGLSVSAGTPDASSANPLMPLMPFMGGSGDSGITPQQQLLLQYQYNNIILQKMIQEQQQQTSQSNLDPSVAAMLMQQQSALFATTPMLGTMGYPMGLSSYGRGSSLGRGSPVVNAPSPFGAGSLYANTTTNFTSTAGRGSRNHGGVEHIPGGLTEKK